MRKVVITDQFVTVVSPYSLSQKPLPFADLVADVEANPAKYTGHWGTKPVITEVADDFKPEMCTTVYAADDNGNAHAWRYRWDSSG